MKLFDFRDALAVYYIVILYDINVRLRVQMASSYNLSFRRNEASRGKSQVFVHTDQKCPIILCTYITSYRTSPAAFFRGRLTFRGSVINYRRLHL